MINYEELIHQGEAAGFTHVVPLECSTIELLPEVRAMCAHNKCHQYNANWSCPPGCGTLEECRSHIRTFQKGLLVQTVGNLDDSMDYESMLRIERLHKQYFLKFDEYLSQRYPGRLSIGSGCCTRCDRCTYPDAPCRFPDKMISSMEAYGMLVTQVCLKNHLPYYYGEGTIAYVSCYFLE